MTTSRPFELSIAMLYVIVVLSLIHVSILFRSGFLPRTLTFFATIYEQTTVDISVDPAILTVALCLSINIFTQKHISVSKYI